ncbi:MAG: DEAD/DEAH box helicase family protein, partial [Longimicrobiales bacterium]|nr:DEAD/DEAH box helicase family protein [Longimicrobiales bacterium]
MSQDARYVEVAVPIPADHTFTYALPRGPMPEPGTRVLVPFRRGERIGWVVGEGDAEGLDKVRPILDVLDDEPSLDTGLVELCRWVAAYYLAPPGLAFRTALPSVLSDASRDYISLKGALAEDDPAARPTGDEAADVGAPETSAPTDDLGAPERRLVALLREREGPQRVQTLRRILDSGSIWPEIRSLKARGWIRHETVPPREPSPRTQKVVKLERWLSSLAEREELFGRAYRQQEAYEALETSGGSLELAHLTGQAGFSRSVIRGLEEKGVATVVDEEVVRDPFADREAPEPPGHEPTPAQRQALDSMLAGLDEESPTPFLLHGVTGSGKTLVYIELLKEVVLERGGGAIVLVPEISLTPQTVTRFRSHFGDRVAVLHSGLSDGERYDAWRQLRS